jgi:hypothetical protein
MNDEDSPEERKLDSEQGAELSIAVGFFLFAVCIVILLCH